MACFQAPQPLIADSEAGNNGEQKAGQIYFFPAALPATHEELSQKGFKANKRGRKS